MESSLVGASTERLRTALQIIDVASQGQMLFIATCNSIAIWPPELRRRFTLSTFFFDLPTAEERGMIWKIYLKEYRVSGELSNDEGWTGARIKECCRKPHRLRITLAQVSLYFLPVSRSAPEQIKALRETASEKSINTSTPGVYQYQDESPPPQRHVRESGCTAHRHAILEINGLKWRFSGLCGALLSSAARPLAFKTLACRERAIFNRRR